MGGGRGVVVYISCSEIVFSTEDPIPAGLKIDASVDWPSQLSDAISLKLHVRGETTTSESGLAAIKILRYDFRVGRVPQSFLADASIKRIAGAASY